MNKMKKLKKQSILSMGASNQSAYDDLNNLGKAEKALEKEPPINRDELHFDMLCIAYDERLETEEEVRKRKEEAEKLAAGDKNAKKKPPPAKGAPAQTDPMDEPQVLKFPVENNMDMGFTMPVYSKWVTSQLQFIKDRSIRDVESKESIWQRIYPQENGSPVISPSGRYWVKLRFQGKERLVEVDDRMPCDSKRRLLFPRTVNNFEIWPHILLKAILKVFSYKWYSANSNFDPEVGDGSIVYSLTGLIPERIDFRDSKAFESEGVSMLRRLLSDDNYFGKKTFVTCFNESDSRPKLPSQQQLPPQKQA